MSLSTNSIDSYNETKEFDFFTFDYTFKAFSNDFIKSIIYKIDLKVTSIVLIGLNGDIINQIKDIDKFIDK